MLTISISIMVFCGLNGKSQWPGVQTMGVGLENDNVVQYKVQREYRECRVECKVQRVDFGYRSECRWLLDSLNDATHHQLHWIRCIFVVWQTDVWQHRLQYWILFVVKSCQTTAERDPTSSYHFCTFVLHT